LYKMLNNEIKLIFIMNTYINIRVTSPVSHNIY
jgi:hypothetical protein